jgi:hypothetical protein
VIPVVGRGYKVVVHPKCVVYHKGGGMTEKCPAKRKALLKMMSASSPLFLAFLYLPKIQMLLGKIMVKRFKIQ